MTSLDRLPLTTAPDLDPSQFNSVYTPGGKTWVTAYYSPSTDSWRVYEERLGYIRSKTMDGIDATDWPEVWAEIISKEQAG